MKRALKFAMALVVFLTAVSGYLSCVSSEGGDDWSAGGGAGKIIPGPGQAGYDAELEQIISLMFRQFSVFNGAPYGVGFMELTVQYGNSADKEILTRFFHRYEDYEGYPEAMKFGEFCREDDLCQGKYQTLVDNPFDPNLRGIIKTFSDGDTGCFGGAAIAADLLRYAVMRDQGYPADEVAAARQRVRRVLHAIDVAMSIPGVPGVLSRGLRRKDHGPKWQGGVPMPSEPPPPTREKWNTHREDNTPDQRYFQEWAWTDNASKDQMVGWVLAMGVAWDVIAEDPDIPQSDKDTLQKHARNFAHMLMRVNPEFNTDMLLRDADGQLTQWCDVNPNILNLEGCWKAGYSPVPLNPFNAIMGLGAIRTMYHITGDEDIRDFYYKDLIGTRKWHEFVRDASLPIVDFGYATNYSNVNMAFMAFYNALRYETNPQVLAVLQEALEHLWDNGRNNRQPKHINQTFFDVIYAGLRAGGNVPAEVAEGIQTIKEWPPMPFWDRTVINCDDEELANGMCLAVDGVTWIELPVKHDPSLYQYYDATKPRGKVGLGHNDEIVAEYVLPRRLRGDSNFDWRSNPFAVNYFGNPYSMQAVGDVMVAYWLGRYLNAGTGRTRNVSPFGRRPVAPQSPTDLVATAVSESQINLAWTDSTNLEDNFELERRETGNPDFELIAVLDRNAAAYWDTGLLPNHTYEYRLRAINDVGSSTYSNVTRASTFNYPLSLPLPVSGLAAIALDHQSIALAWTDNSDNEQGFLVTRMRNGQVEETAQVWADVTSFLDSGLEDGTTYQYRVFSFNSLGWLWPDPPEIAEARTDKLPGIFAVSPEAGKLNVSIYTNQIIVGFEDPVPASRVGFTVEDEVGKITGAWVMAGDSLSATFTPARLLSMSTTYTVTVTVDSFQYKYSFSTEGASWPVNINDLLNKSFAVDVFHSTIVEPAALKDFLGGLLGMNAYLLLGILEVDEPNSQLQLIGALGDMDGPDPTAQDFTIPTLRFTIPADYNTNVYHVGPFDLPITIEGYVVTLEDVILAGTFSPLTEYLGDGSLEGRLDLRAVILSLGEDPDNYIPTICGLAPGVCQGCQDNPNRLECINLLIENIRGELRVDNLGNPIPVTPIAAVTGSVSGTGNTKTIELTLLDPATGDPVPDTSLRLERDSGDGVFVQTSGPIAGATTNAQGKASLDFTDTTGGTNVVKIDITSPVGFTWVTGTVNVFFE